MHTVSTNSNYNICKASLSVTFHNFIQSLQGLQNELMQKMNWRWFEASFEQYYAALRSM